MATEWQLLYWPGCPGRGEFVRLLFEETNTPYTDVFHSKPIEEVAAFLYKGDAGNDIAMKSIDRKSFFAVPALLHNGLTLSQTALIVRYVAERVGGGALYPKIESDVIKAEVLLLCALDVAIEGEFYWHPIDKNAGYLEQKEEAAPFVKYYKEKRLPKWLKHFETQLREAGGEYFVGGMLSYADFAIWHVLCGNEFECPEVFAREEIPLLKAFMKRIGERPRIAEYLASDRREKFTGTGPIF